MINNIIFDFGDIFINLDKQATYIELEKLGVIAISDDMVNASYQYEKGLISTEEFIDFHQQKLPNLTKEQLVFAWNAVLKNFPKNRLDFIKDLAKSKKYRLFLLSNTNEMHISWIKNNIGKEMFSEFESCFEQFYLSHEINFRKPDSEIFEFVLSENNLIPQETLFVDDVSENTKAAKALGIHVWNLIPGTEEVTALFAKNKLLF